MKVDRAQYEIAYELGRDVASGKRGIREALVSAIAAGVEQGSAPGLIYNVGKMLKGVCYKRALSIPATDDYLTWIRKDYGDTVLGQALAAVRLHIDYYEAKRAVKRPGLHDVVAKHMSQLNGSTSPIPPLLSPATVAVITWPDVSVRDIVPLAWFVEDKPLQAARHQMRGSRNGRSGEAQCDVTKSGTVATLDYQPYAEFNSISDAIPGVTRLTFADLDRAILVRVEWQDAGKSTFSNGQFTCELPPATPYVPPQNAAAKTLQPVRLRPGQALFRQNLVVAYQGRCCITGCKVAVALEAAHIDGYIAPASDNVCNGLLLRCDLHALFDALLLAIEPKSHVVHLAASARATPGYADFHGKKITLPQDPTHRPDSGALGRRWEVFIAKNP